MKQELIEKIEGGSRWTKGKYDRLYFDDSELGLKVEHYKTGYISSAEIVEWPYLEGADMEAVNSEVGEISNSYARAITGGKHYIDLDTGEINSCGFFEARIEYLVLKAKKALEAEGKSAEGEDPAMSEMNLAEFKDWVINEFVKERIDDYFLIPTFLTEKYIKDFLSVKISDNKEFALVEVDIKRKGYKRGSYIWRLAVNLKRKRFDIAQSFHKSENGELEERSGVFETDTDRHMKEFENTHIWTEWTDTPDDPNDPTSTRKSTRKMTETEAVEALTEATTADAVQQIIKKTRKDVLLKLSRAVENITATHVKCNAGRSTLERVLLQNAEKLTGIDWQTAIETLERVRRMRKWQDETVRRLATPENLQNLTTRQLIIVGKAWCVKIRKNATKAEKIATLIESKKAVA